MTPASLSAGLLGQLGAPETAVWLLVVVAGLLGLLGLVLISLAVLVVRRGASGTPGTSAVAFAGPGGGRRPDPLGVLQAPTHLPRRSPPPRGLPASVVLMADAFDPDAMLERFKFRAQAVKNRPMPPIEGPGREEFKQQAKLDFMDYSILADGTASLEGGVLTITVDLRPPSS